jgi:hypothetical protein
VLANAPFARGMAPGVILEDGGKRGLAVAELQGRLAEPVVYDGENLEARIARRKAKWTPTQIVWLGAAPNL